MIHSELNYLNIDLYNFEERKKQLNLIQEFINYESKF